MKGYHGVNFAGTSLGGIGANRKLFGQLGDADHLPHTLQPEFAFTKGQAEQGAEAGRSPAAIDHCCMTLPISLR